MRAACVLCAWFVLAALLATTSRAGEQSIEVDGLRVTVSSYWPAALNRGWQPLRVRVENPTAEDRRAELTLRGYAMMLEDRIERAVDVRAGGSETFEVALPVRAGAPNGYTTFVRARDNGYIGSVGAEQASPIHERHLLVARRGEPGAVELAAWATALSAESAPRLPGSAAAMAIHALGYSGGRMPVPAAASASSAPAHVHVSGVAYENLSALPEAYTSLHALVLDVENGVLPPRAALDAAIAGARSGGVLVVAGAGAADAVAKEPSLAAWTEPRFLVAHEGPVATYVLGLGLLLVQDGAPTLDAAPVTAALNRAIEALAPLDRAARREGFAPIPGIDVPFRPLTLLLVLFALLVGPVNLILVRRTRKPALLLLTIPSIAIVFSLGLVAYGIAAQGLDVRATSNSIGVLDQRAHHGSSEELRQVFAGISAGPGLQPGAGTSVGRVGEMQWSAGRREYAVLHGSGGVVLAGAWLPVRTETPLRVTTDRSVRARVDVERGPDGWKVTNGLEADVGRLVFRDPHGGLHIVEGPLVPGRSAVTVPIAESDERTSFLRRATVLALPVADGEFLPRGSWIAWVDRSPLVDPLGFEYDEVGSAHALLGVLDMAGGR